MGSDEYIVPRGAPQRLDRVLPAVVPDLSRGAARRLIADGAVFLNGRCCKVSSRLVRSGDRLRVGAAPAPVPVLALLYEDDELVAVDKPAGMPSAPTREGAVGTALEVLSAQLAARDGRPRPLWLVHRLDTVTSGVLLFAATRAAAAALSAAFQGQTVEKRYLALVDGVPAADHGVVDQPLHRRAGRALVDPAGKPSRSLWRVVRRDASRALLEVRPQSGRMHQIRVHLQWLGHPVVGDRQYGGSRAPRLMLHAVAVRLPHRDGVLEIGAPAPAAFGVASSD
ncbi:MAG: RluA family pseudouridine synthase [Candidatus Binatia bacterium]